MVGEGGIWATWLLASGVLLALFALGCGSGESESTGERLSAGLQRLNAACAAHNRQAAAELLEVYDNPRVKRADSARKAINLEVELILPVLLADAKAQARAIRGLQAPPEDDRRLDALLDAYSAWIDKAQRSPRKTVLENDTYNQARERAGLYGLVACQSSPFGT